MPDVYTEFRKRVEGRAAIRKCFPNPSSLKPLVPDIEEGNIPSLEDLGLPGKYSITQNKNFKWKATYGKYRYEGFHDKL